MSTIRSICVYCGSRPGHDPAYAELARDVGSLIGQRGWELVYGGGKAGLMGVVANAALEAQARVIGVIPQSLMTRELGHPGLHELHVVETMHERKTLMANRADAFLALPGGIGTFEELFEVWTWRQLGFHSKPLGLLNVNGYYDELLSFLEKSVTSGFVIAPQHDLLCVGNEPRELLQRLEAASDPQAREDYSRI